MVDLSSLKALSYFLLKNNLAVSVNPHTLSFYVTCFQDACHYRISKIHLGYLRPCRSLYKKCFMKNVAQNGKKHCPFVSERGDYKYEDKKPIKAQTACFPNDVINNLSFKNIWSLLVLTTKEWITSETLRIKWQKNRRRSPQHHHLLQQPQLWNPRS